MPKRDRASSERPGRATAARRPVVDDVEDLLNVATDERHVIWIWRMTDGEWSLLERKSPAAFRAEGIRGVALELYGGGRYKARVRERSGAWGEQRQFTIEGAPKAVVRETSAAPASSSAPASNMPQLPAWVSQIVLPIATTLGTALAAGLTKKLLETPQADPLLLELIKRTGKGESVDPLALQRTIADAEARGEQRGMMIGELKVRATDSGDSDSGTLSAIREVAPIFTRMLDHADQRKLGAPTPSPAAAETSDVSADHSTALPNAAPDIVPAWLRPFMQYRDQLLALADERKDPTLYADIVLDNAPAEALTALMDADAAGTLETDLQRAMPELAQTPQRKQFARELLAALREGLQEMVKAAQEDEQRDAAKKRGGKASGRANG